MKTASTAAFTASGELVLLFPAAGSYCTKPELMMIGLRT